MSNKYEDKKDALMKEIRSVMSEVEDLYQNAKDDGSEQARDLKAKAQAKLSDLKEQLLDLESTAAEKVKQTAKQTNELVHDQPYYAMGIAALAGVVLGALLVGRR